MTRLRDGVAGWGLITRLLHWGMAGLLVFQLGLGVYMVQLTDLLRRFDLTQLHKSWGTVVFLLALVRAGWRLAAPGRPPLPASMPLWQKRAARADHLALYALMLVLPVSGWVMASASPMQDMLGMQNLVFGRWPLPDPFVPGSATVETAAKGVHLGAAVALVLLILVHAGAAVRHGWRDRDGVLAGMIRG